MRRGAGMKKVGLWIAVIAMSMSMVFVQQAKAASFPDVISYEAEISYLAGKNIIRGFEDGTFGPTKSLTRLQAVDMLLRAKGITDYAAPDPQFTDMKKGKYGYEIVAKAVQLGIISGKVNKDGTKYFDPQNNLTRGQMAKILVEAEGLTINRDYPFSDVPKTNDFHDYISTMAAERITGGYEDGTFKPSQTLSRAHFAVFTARMLDDKFKPAIINGAGSYMLDKKKVYTWKYNDEGEIFTSKISASDLVYEGPENLGLWSESGEEGDGYFITLEDEKGLYEITCHYVDGISCQESAANPYTGLQYPLYVGASWETSNGGQHAITHTVQSINRTVTTKAGTFKNVVEVTDSDGWTFFYARNVGIIKSLENEKVFAELIKLENR